jgi:hypothetical protein
MAHLRDFYCSVLIFLSSMNRTTNIFGAGMNCFEALDASKWMVVIYLRVS